MKKLLIISLALLPLVSIAGDTVKKEKFVITVTFIKEATKYRTSKIDVPADIEKWGKQYSEGLITKDEFSWLVIADEELAKK